MAKTTHFAFVRFHLALFVVAAAILPAWAPLNVPKLDDRSFTDLARAVESLGTSLNATAVSSSAAAHKRVAPQQDAPPARARQTPKTDFGPVLKTGATESACCGPEIEQVRAVLERVRADRERFAEAARAQGNRKALKKIEQLDGQVRAFEKSLSDLERSTPAKPAGQQFTLISNIMKSMHDTAKAIIQNLKG